MHLNKPEDILLLISIMSACLPECMSKCIRPGANFGKKIGQVMAAGHSHTRQEIIDVLSDVMQ